MASPNSLTEKLQAYLAETREVEQEGKLVSFLRQYLVEHAKGKDADSWTQSSDPYSVLSLLVRQLLTRFSHTFLDPTHSPALEQVTLREFLQQDIILLLLGGIRLISLKVDSTHQELADLLIVVLRSLCSNVQQDDVSQELFLSSRPLSCYIDQHNHVDRPNHTPSASLPRHRNRSKSSCNSTTPSPVVGDEALKWLFNAVQTQQQLLSSSASDTDLLILLISVLEGACCRSAPKNSSQTTACLQTLSTLTLLLEELSVAWLKTRNNLSSSEGNLSSRGFLSVSFLSRTILRVWVVLIKLISSSSITSSHISDLQTLLCSPVTIVTEASMNLTKDWLFKGVVTLDSEYTLMLLEALFVSLAAANEHMKNPLTPTSSYLMSIQGILTDSSQEWLVYICSKLQTARRQSDLWDTIVKYLHSLLAQMMREMITTSSQICSCQQMAKKHLMQRDASLSRAISYSPEMSVQFDKLEQRLCKIAQSLLSIFDTIPNIQLLSLQLLAQTGLDKVGIISDFLPRISLSSVWSMPEVLDLYLELLDRAWFQLSPEYAGSADFWQKVHHYCIPLVEGDTATVLQITYHLLFLFTHSSLHLKQALTQHVMLRYHHKMISSFEDRSFSPDSRSGRGIEEARAIHFYLKLLQKMAAHPCSFSPFMDDPMNLYSLFHFLPYDSFRLEVLGIFETALKTLCTPWEASIGPSARVSSGNTHYHLLNSLLKVAFEFKKDQVGVICKQLAKSGPSQTVFDMKACDDVHIMIMGNLDPTGIEDLLTEPFLHQLAIVTDVWGSLAQATCQSDILVPILYENHIWDVIQPLAPALAGILEPLHLMKTADHHSNKELEMALSLQESCVSLLCHLLSMATIVTCSSQETRDPLTVMQSHLSEINSFLSGSRICSIPNASLYIATLFKTACYYPSPPSSSSPSTLTSSQRDSTQKNGVISSTRAAQGTKRKVVASRKQSTIRPVSRPVSMGPIPANPVTRAGPGAASSPTTSLRLLHPTPLSVADDAESDTSGYDADTEHGVGGAMWECDSGLEDEEGRVAGVGGNLQSPVTMVPVPLEVCRRLWLESPIWQCLDLLKECLQDTNTALRCDRCVEVFLSYLLAVLRADHLNLTMLAGKNLLGMMLDCFSPLFEFSTERSKDCWLILCQLIEVLASFQVSQTDVQKLILKFQGSRSHMEQLAQLLHKVAMATQVQKQPSAYVEFMYSRPTTELIPDEMLVLPNPSPRGLEPCTISLWLSIGKYPLQAYCHLLSVFTGEVFLQIWACAQNGDIKICLSTNLCLSCMDTPPQSTSSIIVDSAISLLNWHHVVVSVRSIAARPPKYQLVLVVDGRDVYDYQLNLPSLPSRSHVDRSVVQCYVAGGLVSNTLERHIRLVSADMKRFSWKLSSLHFISGFNQANLASLLFQLGPECAPSSIPDVEEILSPAYMECSQTAKATVIGHEPLSNDELMNLMWPLLSYSAHHSQKVFLSGAQDVSAEDSSGSEASPHRLFMCQPHPLQWVTTANPVTRPQLMDVLQSSVGLEQLVYLYAKTVSECCSEVAQCSAISVIYQTMRHSPHSRMEFRQLEGVRLLQQVLRSDQASLTRDIAGVFIDWCCGRERVEVVDTQVLEHILLDWHIWHKASDGVWSELLWQLECLLSPDNPHYKTNLAQFNTANGIVKILLISKERSLDRLKPLDGNVAMMLVRMVELLIGDPPQLHCLKYICDHLLLPDLNEVKIVRGSDSSTLSDTTSTAHKSANSIGGGFESFTASESLDQGSDQDAGHEVPVFDVQSQEGRLPNSSYTDEETLFTWTDITGLPFLHENKSLDEVPVNLETGLLSVVRKRISLLPDKKVAKVLGPVLTHESIIVMADSSSILVRTAVCRLLDEYFRRGGESSQTNFLQVKGFHLLARQLRQYGVSFELISALVAIIIGHDVNLQSDQGNVYIPKQLSGFQLHAVVPVLACAVNTITQPSLCHSTLCILRELFETVREMPIFMLYNGLLKMLCQMIALAPECSSLSRDNRQMVLNDLLSFCKLVVIFTISTDQEEYYRMLESLLVCLRHYSEELQRKKSHPSLAVVYLEQFLYFVLTEALVFFSSGGTGEGAGLTSSLESCPHMANQTELMSRFGNICTLAVDWVVNWAGPLTTNHTPLLIEGVTVPRIVTFDKNAKTITMATGFVHFLLHYFYRAITMIIRKNVQYSIENSPQRLFISSKPQLCEGFARFLGHLLSPRHADRSRAAILKLLWSLENAHLVLTTILSSPYKKTLCGRLILTVVDLMQSTSSRDTDLREACNGVFHAACQSGATRLKTTTSLSSLLASREEEDSRARQKIETILEDLRQADQRWVERDENGKKGFEHHRQAVYKRLVDRALNRDRAINNSSAQLTSRIFDRQTALKKIFLDQIEAAGKQEMNVLRQWRRVIMENTHSRALWWKDEKRPMCWQLDPTEGPSRVRRRLLSVPRTISERFLIKPDKSDAASRRQESSTDNLTSPLSFIFKKTAYEGVKGLFSKVVRQEGEETNSQPQQCYVISPDNWCRGNLIVSNLSCYFVGDAPVGDPNITKALPFDEDTALLSWQHHDVVEIHKRRYMLKDNALEIFLINGVTFLLSFESVHIRERVHASLLELDMPNLIDHGQTESGKLKSVTLSWQQGELTNFEYLMELNKLAGRTFNDLMQYPVFPFVLADYSSKELDLLSPSSFRRFECPISIQDDSKIDKYVNTYKYLEAECASKGVAVQGVSGLSSKPYHYGSHYSNSGIVLHFLVRIPPFTGMFLDFQGKSFDIADRSFHNVGTTWWLSSSESATDVKELIPEFYYFPEFLVNRERLNFGVKQSGEKVDHVELPPWAKDDPRLFVFKHRQALESEYVSKHLHEWIDLVFGFKQTGKAAIQAINVFHPATYYGGDGINIDAIDDPTQQDAMRAMVKTYGQMPLQLFKEPHQPRSKSTVLTAFRIRVGTALRRLTSSSSGLMRYGNPYVWLYVQLLRQKDPRSTCSCELEFIGNDNPPTPTLYNKLETRWTPERLLCISSGELLVMERETNFFLASSQTHSSLLVTWGNWDNSVAVRSVGFENGSIKLHHHPLNKVTCCQCVSNGQVLVTAGTAGVVSFWTIINTAQSLNYKQKVTHMRGHSGQVNCLVACKPYSIVVSGSEDTTCIIWDSNRLCYINTLKPHDGPVTCVAISPTLGDIATLCSKRMRVDRLNEGRLSPAGLKYHYLRLWTINGKLIKRIKLDQQVMSLCYTSAPEGVYTNMLIGGMANGDVQFWSSWDLSPTCTLSNPFNRATPVLSLAITSCSRELYAGYSNMKVVTWVKPEGDPDSDNGDYVVVSSFPSAATLGEKVAAFSAVNALKFF